VLQPPISPIPTHLTLRVQIDRPYLVDVGFGDSFIRPLPLDSPGPHDGGSGRYHFLFEDGITTLLSLDSDGTSTPQYRFRSVALRPSDFETASNHTSRARRRSTRTSRCWKCCTLRGCVRSGPSGAGPTHLPTAFRSVARLRPISGLV
jgi:arylamine N-acetyltransferase